MAEKEEKPMTPLETLQKYGLKTDVKSIRERLLYVYSYKSIIQEYLTTGKSITNEQFYSQIYKLEDELRTADLSLLCEMAEKGERVNAWGKESKQAIEKAWIIMNDHGAETTEEITLVRHAIRVARQITKSYEAEGEGK